MRSRWIAAYSVGLGAIGWILLLRATRWQLLRANLWPLLLFSLLSLFIKRFGVHITRDVTHSLVGIVDVAAVLALGTTLGAWAAVLSGLVYLELRALRHRLFSWRFMGEHPLFSSGLKALLAVGCGTLYTRLGGVIPPAAVTWPLLLPLAATLLTWFVADHLAWAVRVSLRGGLPAGLSFARRILPYSLLVELVPLPLSIVIAVAYSGMGAPAFLLLALALLASGAMLQRLADVGNQLGERAAELAVLNQFGRRIVEVQLDTRQLCELLYEYCTKVVEAQDFALELLHSDHVLVDLAVGVKEGVLSPPLTQPMSDAMQWMIAQREPLLRSDLARQGLPFAQKDATGANTVRPGFHHMIAKSPQSLLMVPLLAGPQLIGLLTVQSDESYAFREDELRVVLSMANQAAMAISSARTYEAEQRRARQLAAIHEVSHRVASILDLDRLFADVVRLVQETFHYDHVAIFTVDADSGRALFRASTNPQIQWHGVEVRPGTGIVGWVTQFGEPVLANDVTQEQRFAFDESLAHTRAELAVPLKVEKRVVGALDVQSNSINAFTQEDVFVLETLADQVAIAVEDARLYAARQEEAWSSTALLQVAEAVGSLDNLDDILQTVTRITPMLVGADRCSIMLWEEELQEFSWAQGYASDRESRTIFESMRFRPGDVPLLDRVRSTKALIDLTGQPASRLVPEYLIQEYRIGSLLALPLREQAEIHGAMLVDLASPEARFSDRRKAILLGIADQAAMAVANARLHIAQRQEAWVSSALLQVAQALVSSDNLGDNIARIARLTPLLVGVDRCLVFLWDKQREAFLPFQAEGLGEELAQAFSQLHFKDGELPLLDQVKQRQSYVAIEDVSASNLIPDHLKRLFGMCCVLAAPLISKAELLGILLVDYTAGTHRFQTQKIAIIEGIAHQAAIAIATARMYQAALEQERTAEELRLAREIQISFLPERCPSRPGWEVAVDWSAARGVGGDFYDFIPLSANRIGIVIADVSDKGLAAAMFMSMTRTLVRASAVEGRSPAETMQRVNALIMSDSRSGMFVTLFYGVLDWDTGMLTYACAGHNPPLLWHSRSAQTTSLRGRGIALGVLDNIELEERQAALVPGDLLVLYTDGVTEPINTMEEEFGEERLAQTAVSASHLPCADIVHAIHAAVSQFVGDQQQFDDYTLVAVKRMT